MSGTAIYAAIYQILNFLISGGIVVVVGVMFLFFLRLQNANAVAPDKKTGETKLLCHFFTAGGDYYYELCRVSGNTVKSKAGGEYLVNAKCCYQGKWKPGQPGIVQVGIQTAAYIENVTEPIVSKDMQEWLDNPDKKEITAYMQRTALNESTMRAIMAMSEKVWQDVAQMAKFIKNVPYMLWGIIAILGMLGICLYMMYMVMGQNARLLGIYG